MRNGEVDVLSDGEENIKTDRVRRGCNYVASFVVCECYIVVPTN